MNSRDGKLVLRRGAWPWAISRMVRSSLGVLMLLLASMGVAQATIPDSERTVLEQLYIQTAGDQWFNSSGWNGPRGTECTWYGITCNAAGTSVIRIDLHGNFLYGVLPALDGLTNLEYLNVGQTPNSHLSPYNALFGPLPPLNGLKHLKTFVADGVDFSGDLPSLAGMSELERFECRYCALDGHIESLAGLTHLYYFAVTGSPGEGWLHGSIPPLTGDYQLQYFRLEGKFTGPLPDLSGLTQLETFRVRGYRFSGGLPDLVNLPSLNSYWVRGSVSGPMGRIANLPNLQTFDVEQNLLSGSIPSLSQLPKLQTFEVTSNLLSGSIPSLSQLPSLQKFAVGGNQLTGSIPDLSGLDNLQKFYVWFNQLQGSLPAPPQSLFDSTESLGYASATLCPNALTPASDPPSAIDEAWSTITKTTPWSADCATDAPWQPYVHISSSLEASLPGEAVTYVAVVYGLHPTGTVTFKAQSQRSGDWPLITMCADVPIDDAAATCTYGDLDPRGFEYNIYAFYSGDADNAPAHTRYAPGVAYADLFQYLQNPRVEASTDDSAQVGQPVDLTVTYDDVDQGPADDTVTFYKGLYDWDTSMKANQGDAICAHVPVHTSRAGDLVAHCVTHFASAGPKLLTAEIDGYRSNPVPFIQHVVSATPFDADQFALTGPWYNPATSGQGLEFVVYPDLQGAGVATLVGGWFTYDAAGQQRWLSLQGDLASGHGAAFDLKVGQGGGGSFDVGPAIAPAVIGSAQLTFYDCGHAALSFTLDDGRSGTIPYVRLDAPTACSSAVPATLPATLPAHYSDALHGGAWYSPATSGQGLFVDFVPAAKSFFGLWFTYAPPSDTSDSGVARQRWFALQANGTTPGDLSLHDVAIIASSGGAFNQPSPIAIGQVGTADISFTSCTAMTLHYHFDSGEFAGLDGRIDEHVLSMPSPACH